MNTTSNDTLPSIIEDGILQLGESANNALVLNKLSLEKATVMAGDIIAMIEKTPLDDTPACRLLDETCKNFLQKASVTVKTMKERREPVTRFFDEIRKVFTGMENRLDKNGEHVISIRGWRDKYATHLADIEKKKREEADRKRKHDEEIVAVRAFAKKFIADTAARLKEKASNEISAIFNAMDLTNVATTREKIRGYNADFEKATRGECFPDIALSFITPDEYEEAARSVAPAALAIAAEEHEKHVADTSFYYLERVESRVAELLAIAAAGEQEKKRLEQEAGERRAAELEKQKEELLAFSRARETAIKGEETADTLTIAFEAVTPVAPVKRSLEIRVKNPAAWGHIFIFWFDKEGRTLPPEKIEKYTLGRVKKYCEDHANKGAGRVESPFIEYVEIVKAI